MVRRTTRIALVLLALLSVAGLPAVGIGDDTDGAAGRAVASGPLTTEESPIPTDLLTTTEVGITTTDTATTDTTTTDTAITETTTTTAIEPTVTTAKATTAKATTAKATTAKATTATTTDDSLLGTTTLADEVPDETDEATNATDEVANTTDEAANATDEVANATDELANATDGTANSTVNATRDALVGDQSGATDIILVSTAGTSTRLSLIASSPLVGTATGTLDDAGGLATTRSSGDAPADRTESGATTAGGGPATTAPPTSAARGSGETTAGEETTARDETTAKEETTASAGPSENDNPPERSAPARPRGPRPAVGVGALAAAALLPHLADGLALAGSAGLSSASSVVVTPTGVRRSLRQRFDRLWRFATLFRYSRWDDSDPLDHEGRAALYEAIEESPGAYLSAVCESADVPVSTARHHLDVLEDEGLVTAAKVRGKRRFYPGHADDVELVAALEDEGTAPVLHALARLGDCHGGHLADELDRDPSTVSHHLSRLEDAGLVEREREGRAVVNRLAPEAREVLCGGEADAEAPAVAD